MNITQIIKNSGWSTEDVNALSAEGYELLLSNSVQHAISCFWIAHILEPKESYHSLMLGIAYARNKEYNEALYTLKRVKLIDENPIISLHILTTLLSLNDYENAKIEAINLSDNTDTFISNFAKGILTIISSNE